MDRQELCMYLMEQLGDEVASESLDTIEEQRKAFLALNNGDFHKSIPRMGEHKKLKVFLKICSIGNQLLELVCLDDNSV